LRLDALDIAGAGIRACNAQDLTTRALDRLEFRANTMRPRHVIAAGKAAVTMAGAALDHPDFDFVGGVVVGPSEPTLHDWRMAYVVGGHPVPTPGSEEGGRRALEYARTLSADDSLLVLLSGGASALMAVPADGVTLDDKRQTTTRLLRAGADIHALNTVRKHLSAVKGGQLAAATRAACTVLIISDVVGDDLSVIASGPTVADGSRFSDALDVLRRCGGVAQFPDAVVRRLTEGAEGRLAETPKPGDPRLARVSATIVGSRRDAMDGAVAEASRRGYRVVRIDDPVIGDSRTTAVLHLRRAYALTKGMDRPVCVVSSGETTVEVSGTGSGGRNQEFALAAAPILGQLGAPAAVASVGTDGVDGPTDAAGAYADSTTVDRALAEGRPPDRYLANNDSYAFFGALGDLIHTGPTGTNVGDLQLFLLA
jgi:hydroxypyruvate reductase